MDLLKANEKSFRQYVETHLWEQIDPGVELLRERAAAEVRIGSFALDLVAQNADGGLTIVEFKVNMVKTALSQMLLYPRALRKAIHRDSEPDLWIRMVLVSSYIDRGVAEFARDLSPHLPSPLVTRLCVRRGDAWALVDPLSREAPDDQCFGQDEPGAHQQLCWQDGAVCARGTPIWTPAAPARAAP